MILYNVTGLMFISFDQGHANFEDLEIFLIGTSKY